MKFSKIKSASNLPSIAFGFIIKPKSGLGKEKLNFANIINNSKSEMKINISRGINEEKPSGGFRQFMREEKSDFNTAIKVEKPLIFSEETEENKKNATAKIIDWVVKFSIYATVFFIPLFFLPIVPSALELNKQFLLVILAGIGFLAWVGKMAWLNEIRFKKNFILIPALTFVGILALSSFFSAYSAKSIWGDFGQESKSLMTMIFLLAFFILIYNNVKTKKEAYKIVFILLISGFIVALYGLLQIWGKFIINADALKNPYFNTIGSVYLLSVYAGAMFLLSVSLFLDNLSKIIKIILIFLSAFFFFVLIVVNLSLVWKVLLIGLAVILGVSIVRASRESSQKRLLPMIYLVLALLIILINKPLIKSQMPVEVYPNYKTSYKIMMASWKDDALLGKGLGNYQLVYQLYRPDGLGDFWSVNFSSGNSFFTTLGSTTGILGTLAFLFLVASSLMFLFRSISKTIFGKKEGSFMVAGVGTIWLFLTILMFLYFSNVTILMLWWMSLALLIAVSEIEKGEEAKKEFIVTSQNPRSSFSLSFTFVLVIIGLITAIYLQSQNYVAAANFYQALDKDAKGAKLEEVVASLTKAINIDPSRDVYYRNISLAAFALANQRVAEKGQDLSADDSAYISAMIKDALRSADAAVNISPKDSQNYISLANVYEGVLVSMEQADEQAIENYQKALELDPKNPALYQRIANIYVTLADVEASRQQQQNQSTELPEKSKEYLVLAKENIGKALQIKSDYTEANLLLSSIYEKEGNLDKAIENEKNNKELYPGDPVINFRLGLIYYKKEDFKNAEIEFSEAIRLNSKYANARYFLALTYSKEEQKDKALEQLRLIEKENQDNNDLKKMISNLENGKDIMDGLAQEQNQSSPLFEGAAAGEGNQNEINPQVEQQAIPEEATPTIEELNQNPEENPEKTE